MVLVPGTPPRKAPGVEGSTRPMMSSLVSRVSMVASPFSICLATSLVAARAVPEGSSSLPTRAFSWLVDKKLKLMNGRSAKLAANSAPAPTRVMARCPRHQRRIGL